MVKMNWDFMNHILPRLENVEVCFLGVKSDIDAIDNFDELLVAARAVARVSDSGDSPNRDSDVADDDDDADDVVAEVIKKIVKKRKKMRRSD